MSSVCSVVTEECQQARNKCEVCKRGEGEGEGGGREGALWEVRGVHADTVQEENRRNGRGR